MEMDKNNEIRSIKREYYREWRKKNPDKVRAAQERYWQRQLEKRRKSIPVSGSQH